MLSHRSTNMTSAPSQAKRSAWLRPRPLAAPVTSATLPARRLLVTSFSGAPSLGGRIDQYATDIGAGVHVGVAVVDLLQGVGAGHHGFEVHLTGAVQLEDLWDVGTGIARAVEGSDDLLFGQGEVHQVAPDLPFQHRVDVGDHQPAPLGGHGQRPADQLAVADSHGADELVHAAVPGSLGDNIFGLVPVCRGMRGSHLHRFGALVLRRVDDGDRAGTREPGTLHRRGADATDPGDGDCVARPDLGGVDRRSPTGDEAAAEQTGQLEAIVVRDLYAPRLVHHGVVCERANAASQCEVFATQMVAGGSVVNLHAGVDLCAEVAQALMSRRA